MSKDKNKRTQWHPLFAELLRPLLQDCYEVEIDLPVGDLPRKADIVLLQRTGSPPKPFSGLLRHLTTWNILEFKGRSVSARIRHLDLLVEVGLGIDRQLNEKRVHQRVRPIDPAEVSFWYIVNHMGKRFVRQAQQRLGALEEASPGVWRSQILLRPIFLIDGRTVPVDRETVPIHLVGEESRTIDEALARVIIEEPGYWELYGVPLGVLHPSVHKEADRMAKSRVRKGDLDLRPWVKNVGLQKILAALDMREVVKEVGVERILRNLSAEDRRKLKELLK